MDALLLAVFVAGVAMGVGWALVQLREGGEQEPEYETYGVSR